MKTLNDLLKHLKKEFSVSDFAENKELAMLYVYCQENKEHFISTLPNSMSHLYKKYCNKYSVKEMLEILKVNNNSDFLSIRLIEHLRNADQKGQTKFITNSKALNMLVVKYL